MWPAHSPPWPHTHTDTITGQQLPSVAGRKTQAPHRNSSTPWTAEQCLGPSLALPLKGKPLSHLSLLIKFFTLAVWDVQATHVLVQSGLCPAVWSAWGNNGQSNTVYHTGIPWGVTVYKATHRCWLLKSAGSSVHCVKMHTCTWNQPGSGVQLLIAVNVPISHRDEIYQMSSRLMISHTQETQPCNHQSISRKAQ